MSNLAIQVKMRLIPTGEISLNKTLKVIWIQKVVMAYTSTTPPIPDLASSEGYV